MWMDTESAMHMYARSDCKMKFFAYVSAHIFLHDLTHNNLIAKWLHNMLTCFFFSFSECMLDSSHAPKTMKIKCTIAARNVCYTL